MAIIKCKGNDNSNSDAAQGNWIADMAVKIGAGYVTQMVLQNATQECTTDILHDPNIAVEQDKA